MGLLDAMIYGVRDILADGVALVRRSKLNFSGDFDVTDNDVDGSIDIALAGGGGGSPGGSSGDVQVNNAGAFAGVSPGTSGFVLTSNGSAWVSAAAAFPTTGTLVHERGGLEADVSAYNGLVKISGGATSAVTAPTGAIVGTTDTQTLTNKTFSLASNTLTATSAQMAAAISDETGTGLVVFSVGPRLETPSIWNNGLTFRYIFAGSAIAANRTTTLPLLTGDDTFVFAAHAQTLTNKTISGASNTLTVRLANDVTGTLPVANGGTAQTALITAMGALDVDWSTAPSFTKTLGAGGNTITFSNRTSGQTIIVRLTSNGGGSTVTWPTVKWPGGVAPTQTSTGRDVYTFFYDGTDVYGSAVQAMA